MGMNAAKESLCHFFTSFLLLIVPSRRWNSPVRTGADEVITLGELITYCASFYTQI